MFIPPLYFGITLNVLCLFVQGLPLVCRVLVVPVVEEGCIWVGLICMWGCGDIVSLVGSHVQRLVAGWAECSSCSGDWRQVQLCSGCCSSS